MLVPNFSVFFVTVDIVVSKLEEFKVHFQLTDRQRDKNALTHTHTHTHTHAHTHTHNTHTHTLKASTVTLDNAVSVMG